MEKLLTKESATPDKNTHKFTKEVKRSRYDLVLGEIWEQAYLKMKFLLGSGYAIVPISDTTILLEVMLAL